MSKMIKAAKVSNVVMAGVTVVEGVCASVVVDKALKDVPGNKFVNLVGRSVVSSLIIGACGIAAQGFLELNKMLDDTDDKHDGYRKLTIVDAKNHKIKQWHKPGDLININAWGLHSEESEFMYWYGTKGNVNFEDSNSEATSFIMPDENVRVEFAVFGHSVHVPDEDQDETTEPEEDATEEETPTTEPDPVKDADTTSHDLGKDMDHPSKK